MIHLLSDLVDRQAARAPEREAFVDPDDRLTWGDLAERSNRLAHLLADEGVRPGDRVGIFMPRCVESAVAVYGILKAGAAYVPIDPSVPLGGLERLVEDCGIACLVSHPAQLPTLRGVGRRETGLAVVVGPADDVEGLRTRGWEALEGYPSGGPPEVSVLSDDLAYIMYSSGSTGRPKGIMHTHRSGLAYAHLSVDTYGVDENDRIGNHSPLHFDMSTFGYFSGPCAGAATLLVPEAYTKLAASLSQLMETERVTIWYSVPLALIQLLTRGVLESRDLSSLRWVLFGGEPFPRKHVEALMRHWPGARFSNVYGPAEVNQCTYYHVPLQGEGAGDPGVADDGPIPIGRIWADTEGMIVNESDERVGDGEVGELLVRSSTMMRGYWARPDLDAQAFYRQPLHPGYGRRFYRTGDLVSRREDGEMMFLGRKDRQVKVRGYRVELDEIEGTLATHPRVEEAAVYPVRRGDEIERLEASVLPNGDDGAAAALDPAELKAFMADVVSWYAVPRDIEVVEALPRTATGKIDRRRLQQEAERRAAEVGS